jgi:hypothetical protein
MVKFSKSTLGKVIKFIVAVGSLVVSTFFVQACAA